MTLLSCAFEHFTRHLQRNAVGRSDQRPTSRMKRRVRRRRTVCSPARRFPLTLRVAIIRSPCAFRACLLADDCSFTRARARACDVTHYTRSEAFSSLPESLRWMRDWPSYLYSRPASTPFSRGHCAMFVAPQAKRRSSVPAFRFDQSILFMFKQLSKKIEEI